MSDTGVYLGNISTITVKYFHMALEKQSYLPQYRYLPWNPPDPLETINI